MSLVVSDFTGVLAAAGNVFVGCIGCKPAGGRMAFILTGDLDFMGSRSSNADKSAFRLLPDTALLGLGAAKLLAPPSGPSMDELVELLKLDQLLLAFGAGLLPPMFHPELNV